VAADAPRKVVLAYSGGLDTSVILRWLQDTYACEVVTFTADLGQGEELEPARNKAQLLGVREIYVEDLRDEFVRDFVFPMFRANTVYEGTYLLGTSIARPLIAKRLVEIARETGADAIAHGATARPAPTPSPTAPRARATIRSASSSTPTPSIRASG
jgi:argininosuccinate synthase